MCRSQSVRCSRSINRFCISRMFRWIHSIWFDRKILDCFERAIHSSETTTSFLLLEHLGLDVHWSFAAENWTKECCIHLSYSIYCTFCFSRPWNCPSTSSPIVSRLAVALQLLWIEVSCRRSIHSKKSIWHNQAGRWQL